MIENKRIVRNLEILSLIISIIGWPLIWLYQGFNSYVYSLKRPDPTNYYLVTILFLFLGLIWDTRFFAGGHVFVKPFKKYLLKEEIQNDIVLARCSIFSNLFIFLLLIQMFKII